MPFIELFGLLAAILTSASFIPQALKIIRTGDTESISLPMYVMFVAGVCCWLVYGIVLQMIPIILANLVTLLFSGIVLYFKVRDVLRRSRTP